MDKLVVPITLSLVVMTFLQNPLHVYAITNMSTPYNEGFDMGFARRQDNCSFGGASSSAQDACVQGFLAGQNKAASLTLPYQTGYNQGVKDHLDGVSQNFCGTVFPNNFSSFSLQWSCKKGYEAGREAPPTLRLPFLQSMPPVQDTEAYEIGYLAGSNNSSLGYQACTEFNARDGQICSHGFDAGYNTLPWSKTEIFNLGYKYGYTASKENNTSSDIAGDCSFVVVNVKKTAVCESGWQAGYEAREIEAGK
jgi:hypothetical protein